MPRTRLATTATVDPHEAAECPDWRPIRPLLRDGIRLSLMAAGYLAVPVFLLLVTLGGPLEGIGPTGTTDGLFFLVGTTLTTLLAAGALGVTAAVYVSLNATITTWFEGSLISAIANRRPFQICVNWWMRTTAKIGTESGSTMRR